MKTLIKLFILSFFILCNSHLSQAQSKSTYEEIIFDWNSPSFAWENAINAIPANSPFTLVPRNFPDLGTGLLKVVIYESTGGTKLKGEEKRDATQEYTPIKADSTIAAQCLLPVKNDTIAPAVVYANLKQGRYYFIDITFHKKPKSKNHSENPVNGSLHEDSTAASPPPAVEDVESIKVKQPSEERASTPDSTGKLDSSTPSNVSEQENKELDERLDVIYEIPIIRVLATVKLSEITRLDFFQGIGPVWFPEKKFNNFGNTEPQLSLAAGLHIRLAPVSTEITNDKTKFIRPRLSRFAAVLGAELVPMTYDGITLNPVILEIKPFVGASYDITPFFGLSIGSLFANLPITTPTGSRNKLVSGLWVKLSLSSSVYSRFRTASGRDIISSSSEQK